MEEQQLVPTALHKDFESIKKTNGDGLEYWEARELMPLLNYSRWEDFHKAIKRAMVTCGAAGQIVRDHFRDAPKMVDIGSKTQRELKNYQLSRFACYLTTLNGDPRKPEIAFAQTYFAVQTRKQELFERLDEDGKRLFARREVASHNKQLFDTAKKAGVENFGKFNNAGYLGLYGLTAEEIKQRKGIREGDLLDYAGGTELAANLFRITQTDAKIQRDDICGEDNASIAHRNVGSSVRKTIQEIGGTMPEDLPPEQHITDLAKKKLGSS